MKVVRPIFPMLLRLAFTLLSLALVHGAFAQSPLPLYPGITPVCAPEDLRQVSLPNTTIESVTTDPATGAVRVTAIVTHPPARDRVKVWIELPAKNWNGRFLGTGGSGFLGGRPENMRGPVAQGFAAGATDTGHEGGGASFALHPSRRLNWQEIRDFAYLGIHDMTVVGKALVQAFYGKPPRYSYFAGTSTGGRQGLMEAQRYPDDYDGIVSRCPAIGMERMSPTSLWPQIAMLEAKHFVPKTKLDAATAAAIAACDGVDGVTDGVIDDPLRCTWDPRALVGTTIGGAAFTEADADVIRKIWDGPRGVGGRFIWHGVPRGADLFALAGTEGTPLTGRPFGIAVDWFRYFIAQDPQWDWRTLTPGEFELFINQSAEIYGAMAADDPDLARFRDRGGKAILAHGLADQLIPPQGSIDYYERVQQRMGGAEATAAFARLFLVPGVDHGFRGAGPSPTLNDLIAAIIAWVEEGKAPDRLLGESRDASGKVTRTRPVFPYPHVAKYAGTGSTDDAANFVRHPPAPATAATPR